VTPLPEARSSCRTRRRAANPIDSRMDQVFVATDPYPPRPSAAATSEGPSHHSESQDELKTSGPVSLGSALNGYRLRYTAGPISCQCLRLQTFVQLGSAPKRIWRGSDKGTG